MVFGGAIPVDHAEDSEFDLSSSGTKSYGWYQAHGLLLRRSRPVAVNRAGWWRRIRPLRGVEVGWHYILEERHRSPRLYRPIAKAAPRHSQPR